MIDRFSELELIQLTNLDNSVGIINDTVLNQAISDAEAEINGYLTAYTLPLTTVPANLVRIACDIARYYLYADAVTPRVQDLYDSALKFLLLIGKGVISLGADAAGQVNSTGNLIIMTARPILFGRES